MPHSIFLRLLAASGALALGLSGPVAAQEEPPADETPAESPPPTDPSPTTDVPVVTEPPAPPEPVEVPEAPAAPEIPETPAPLPEPEPEAAPAPAAPAADPTSPPAPEVSEAPEPLAATVAAAPNQEDPGPPDDPPGNNGTVKVDGTEFDSHPNNQPHVGCTFQIDFYGYDEGDFDASVTFEGVPPTGGGILLTDTVFIGGDPAGGGVDLDASKTYDLSAALAGITPHPVQGHHVNLTVNAEGSQGADTKHKTFWVEGCVTVNTTTTTTSTTTTTVPETTTTVPETTTTVPESTTTVPPVVTTMPPADQPPEHVEPRPASPEAPEVAAAQEARARTSEGSLPQTGTDVAQLVSVGLVLLLLGMGGVALARFRRSQSQ